MELSDAGLIEGDRGFHPFQLFWLVWELFSNEAVWSGRFFVGRVFTTNLITILIYGDILCLFYWIVCVPKSISSRFFNLLAYSCSKQSLMIDCLISVLSVAISPFHFRFCYFGSSPFPLFKNFSWSNDVLFIFSREKLFTSLLFCIRLFSFSNFNDFFLCTNFEFHLFLFFCLWGALLDHLFDAVWILWDRHSLLWTFLLTSLFLYPLSVDILMIFISRDFSNFPFDLIWPHSSFRSMLFSLHVFAEYLDFLTLLISSFLLLWL